MGVLALMRVYHPHRLGARVMFNRSQGRLRRQVDTLRHQFLQEGGLPFADVLSAGGLEVALREVKAAWNDRIYPPLVTLWVFLGQVLNADQSCRAAVARLIAHRASQGLEPCSSETGAYCQARKRLPERFFAAVARLVGRNLDARRPAVALEGPPRLPVRRLDGLHARHPGEPARVPPDLQPGARDVLRSRSDRGDHLALVWCDSQPGRLPL